MEDRKVIAGGKNRKGGGKENKFVRKDNIVFSPH